MDYYNDTLIQSIVPFVTYGTSFKTLLLIVVVTIVVPRSTDHLIRLSSSRHSPFRRLSCLQIT